MGAQTQLYKYGENLQVNGPLKVENADLITERTKVALRFPCTLIFTRDNIGLSST